MTADEARKISKASSNDIRPVVLLIKEAALKGANSCVIIDGLSGAVVRSWMKFELEKMGYTVRNYYAQPFVEQKNTSQYEALDISW